MKKQALSKHVIVSGVILTLGIVLIAFLFRGLDFRPKQIPSVLVGRPAPDFQASWIQGKEFLDHQTGTFFTLADVKGKKVILNFWASWCVSCRQEARELQEFWLDHKQDDVLVVGIAVQDTQEAALAFAKQYGKGYPLGLDEDGSASINYGVAGVPETFFIDRSGKIVEKVIGPVDRQSMAEHLGEL